MSRAWFVVTVLFALLFDGIPSTGAEHEGVVFVQQHGSTGLIEGDVGQEFTLVVGSNPSTGYRWQFGEPLDELAKKRGLSRISGCRIIWGTRS